MRVNDRENRQMDEARNVIPLRILVKEMKRRRVAEMVLESASWLLILASLVAINYMSYLQGKIAVRNEIAREVR